MSQPEGNNDGPPLHNDEPPDFSFLLRPEIYHTLTALNVPASFRDSPKQPDDPDTNISQLLQRGHFRAAAIAAVRELTGSGGGGGGGGEGGGGERGQGVDARDGRRILDLFYTRLACLTLIDATPLAAQEAKALEDLNSVRVYVDVKTGQHLAPWPLRLLNVRLQSLGFGDPRRAVMSYYDLAREARLQISKSKGHDEEEETQLWTDRLHDLAMMVAGALVEMDDLAGAAHHLESLPEATTGSRRLSLCRALLALQVGDVDRARKWAGSQEDADKVVHALCDVADADYGAALAKLEEGEGDDDETVAVNKAVCLLYLGRMDEGRRVLEKRLATRGASSPSPSLLFNLSTMYELCTDRHRRLKTTLAERVAGMEESPAGWERNNADFKL
ncbi:hypothetical protein L249_8675 [Ophiocordyceps polyrhachis-furcata BCC 54312]|uniref:Trafficking protein particle complex subunit 12 n=1 Tax=Ophiocordyceps polyrhachis-furcata BCC 54312 TaxID=1330021 RepID=A0A367L6D9_9HYPO|nr:hypothetical protein L249_8675 [Ophiocordyceps polyrhachis-furcata BCC 54312]